MSKKNSSAGKTVSPPPGDVNALYSELVERFYGQGDRARAEQVAGLLRAALGASEELADSIRGEEIRSLLAELGGDYVQALRSREAEVRKILELHQLAWGTPSWDYVARQYDFGDVSDRLDLLAILYDAVADTERAVATLRESERYCRARAIPFDGQDLLDEFTRADGPGGAPVGQAEAKPVDQLDDAIRAAYEGLGVSADAILTDDDRSQRFLAEVRRQIGEARAVSDGEIKSRLLALRRRSALPQRPRRP